MWTHLYIRWTQSNSNVDIQGWIVVLRMQADEHQPVLDPIQGVSLPQNLKCLAAWNVNLCQIIDSAVKWRISQFPQTFVSSSINLVFPSQRRDLIQCNSQITLFPHLIHLFTSNPQPINTHLQIRSTWTKAWSMKVKTLYRA